MLRLTHCFSLAALLWAGSCLAFTPELDSSDVSVHTKKKADSAKATPKTARPNRPLKPMPALGEAPFPEGEQLAYMIKVGNLNFGEALLRVGKRTTYESHPAISFAAFIRTNKDADKIYSIDDKQVSVSDQRTFLPFTSQTNIRENKGNTEYLSIINQDKQEIKATRTKKKVSKHVFNSAPNIYDPLSAVYAVRRMDLKPGMEFELYVWDGRKERLIGVKVGNAEKVKTPKGTQEALKLSISSTITGGTNVTKKQLSEKPAKGSVWLSTDTNRLPLKLVFPSPISILGNVEAYFVNRTVESGDVPK